MTQTTPTSLAADQENRRAARRRSLAFLVFVVLVALLAGIIELGLTIWEKVESNPAPGSGRAATLGGLAPARPTPGPTTPRSPGPGGPGPGSAAATGSFLHQNTATVEGGSPVTCNDTDSPQACGAVFAISGARPGSRTAGTVVIQSQGSAPPSLFQLSLASATASPPSSPLCADLTLQVTDSEAVQHVLYQGPLTAMPTLQILDDAADATWPSGGSGRFNFAVGLPTSSGDTDQSASCSVSVRWTQSPA